LFGSIEETPLTVANQNFPSLVLNADGEPGLHSLLLRPSAVEKTSGLMKSISPSAKALSSFLSTRKIPLCDVIQR